MLDGEGYLTETVYDVAGNVEQTIRYDRRLTYTAGSSTFSSLRTAAQGATSRTMSYQYDGAGRVTQETNYQGTITTYAYDSVGQLISTTKAQGTSEARTSDVRYDVLGRVIQELSAEGRALITGSMTQAQIDDIWNRYGVTYAYDLAGRKISATTRPNDAQTNTTRYYYDNDNRLRFEINQLGERIEYRYNALNQLVDEIYYTNRISTTGLNGGLLTTALITTLTGNTNASQDKRISYQYSLSGKVSSVRVSKTTSNAEDGFTTYTYNAFGEQTFKIESIDATRTLQHEYIYDNRGLLTTTRWDNISGGFNISEGRTYDSFGRLRTVTDARNVTSSFEYDRLGRQIASVDGLSGRRTTTYDAFSRTLTTRDALNNATTYTYNDATRTTTLTTPEGITVTTVNNRHGQTLTVNSAGNTTTYGYDVNGNLTSVSDTLGALESRTYDRAGRQLTQSDARGAITTFAYDAANRVLTRTVDAASGGLALQTIYAYDGQGRITDVTEPNGRLTHTTYDRGGRVVEVAIDPSGLNLRTSYTYDRQDHVITLTEGLGNTNPRRTQYIYDTLGRRTEEIVDAISLGGTLNLRTQYRYDANNNLTRKIDANGNSTWYVYDADNRLTHSIDALGGVTRSLYDIEGRIIETRRYATPLTSATLTSLATNDAPTEAQISRSNSSMDAVSRSFFDRDGRERYTIDAAGTLTERTFDANGNVTRTRMYNSPALTGTYADLAAVTSALGSAAGTIGANDRLQWTAYDLRGQAAFTIDGLGGVTQYTYDANGNIASKTEFATLRSTALATDLATLQSWASSNASNTANRTTRFWYDATDRIRFTLDAEGYLSEARYNDATREETSIVYAAKPAGLSGSSTLANLVSAAAAIANSTNDQSTRTVYDRAGRAIQVIDALGRSEYFGYDAVGNKTSFTNKKGASAGDPAYTWNYEYDAAGRMTYERTPAVDYTTVTDGGGALTANDPINARLVTRFEYDALGNVRFRHEAYGTSQVRVTEYRYDELSRQVRTIHPSVGVYNATAGDVSLGNGAAVSRTETAQALYSEVAYDTLGNAYRNRDVAGNYSFKVYDNLGRISYEVDAENYVTRYQYDRFGNQTELTRYANPLSSSLPTNTASVTASDITSTRLNPNPSADRVIVTGYDRLNRVISVTQPSVSNYEPNATAGVGGTTYTAGAVTLTEYNSFGDVVRVRKQLTNTPTYADTYLYYDRLGQRTAEVDPMGYLTTFEYDETGDLKRTVEYARPRTGSLNTTTYGTIVTTTRTNSPNNAAGYDRETRFGYDTLNRKISETKVGLEYSSATGTSVSSTSTDQVTTFGYDALGNQTRVTLEDVSVNGVATDLHTYTYYDVLGRTIAIAEPARNPGNGSTLIPYARMLRDAHGNLVQQIQYGGGATSIPGNGSLPTAATAPAATPNRTTTLLLDAHGRAIRTRDASGAERFASYNARGELVKEWQVVTNDGNPSTTADNTSETLVTLYRYDNLGRQKEIIEPQRHSGATTTSVKSLINYNAFGEIISKGVFEASATAQAQEFFHYDQAGRVWRTNSGDGVTKVYLYNLAGQVTAELRSQTVDLSSSSFTSAQNVVTSVAPADLMRTETRYDARGSVVEQRLPTSSTSNGPEQVTTDVQITIPPPGSVPATLPLTHSVVSSSAWYVTPNPNGGQWIYSNKVSLTWPPLGSGPVQVIIRYRDKNPDGTPATTDIYSVNLSGVSSGAEIEWQNELTATHGGIYDIQDVYVYGAGGVLLRASTVEAAPPEPVYVHWTGTLGQFITKFEYRAQGSTGSYTSLGVLDLEGDQVGVNVANLPASTYEYRITHQRQGDVTPYAESTGTFQLETGLTTEVAVTHTPVSNADEIANVAVSASGPQPLTFSLLTSSAWYFTPNPPNDGMWIYDNSVDLDWANIGTGPFKVTIYYVNKNPDGSEGSNQTHTSNVLSNGGTGLSYTWSTPNATTSLRGGVHHINRVVVTSVDGSGNPLVTLRDSQPVAGPPKLIWAAPNDASVTAVFRYKRAADSGWGSANAARFGGDFQVDIQSFLVDATTYDYEIEHWRNGTLIAKKAGQLNSTGVVTTKTITGTFTDTALTTFDQNVATPSVIGLSMVWTPPPAGSGVTATFEYRQGSGAYQTLSISQGSNWAVNLGSLSQNVSYEYQITYRLGGRIASQQRGTFNLTTPPSTTTTTTTASANSAPAPTPTIPTIVGMDGVASATTSLVRTAQWYSTPTPEGGQWIYWNEIYVAYPDLGARSALVSISYYKATNNGSRGVLTTKNVIISNAGSAATVSWEEPNQTSSQGGIHSIVGVKVFVQDANGAHTVLARDSVPTGTAAPPSLSWTAPSDSSLTPRFWYYSGGWIERTVVRSGSTLSVNLTGIPPGDYSYEVGYYRPGESPSVVYKTGSFRTNTISTSVLSQSSVDRNPAWVTVSAAGSTVSWTTSAVSGSTVSFSYYNGTSWVPLSVSNSGGTNYSVNFAGVASGNYSYRLNHYRSGETLPYASSTGNVEVDTRTVVNETVLSVTPTFNAKYPPAQISPVSFATSSATVSWNYAKQNSADSVVFKYTVNGTTYTAPISGSGPSYSAVMTALPVGSNLAVSWTLEYLRSGETYSYARANGNATLTVTGTTTNPVVTLISQAPVYPSGVQQIAAPQDLGNNILRWTTPAESGATITFMAGTTPLAVTGSGSDYRVDVSSLEAGTYSYQIRYTRTGQSNPYAVADGTFTIARGTGPVTSATVTPNVPTFSNDPVTRHADALNTTVRIGVAIATTTPDYGYVRTETRGPNGELYIEVEWAPGIGGYNRDGQAGTHNKTTGRYIYWSDPPEVVGETTPVFVYRLAGSSTWNTLSVEKVFNGNTRYLGANVGALGAGTYEYQIRYFRSGDTTPFAVRTGNVTNPASATGVTDTTTNSIRSTDVLAPRMFQATDRWGNAISTTDAAGNTTYYRFNQLGQLIERRLPSVEIVSVGATGTVTTTTGTPTARQYYDVLGQLIASQDENGNVNALTLNAAGQAISETHANNTSRTATFDVFGNKIAETNERGFRTEYTYDSRNLLTQTVQDAGVSPTWQPANLITNSYVYDQAGRRIAQTDGNTLTTRNWYDLLGNLIRTVTPMERNTAYEYDLQGNKTKETDAIGGVKRWTYNYFGWVIDHHELGSEAVAGIKHTYGYNWAGLLTSNTSDAGQNLVNAYDAAGHLIESSETGMPTMASGLQRVLRVTRYEYDIMGRQVHVSMLLDNRLEQEARIQYDAAGRLASMWDRGAGTRISYDAAGNRTRIQSSALGANNYATAESSPFTFTWQTLHQISKDWVSEESAWDVVNTDLWYAYDSMNRTTISRGTNSGGTVSGGIGFTYDAAGNKKTRSQKDYVFTWGSNGLLYRSGDPTASTSTDTYMYDGANRLTDVIRDGITVEHYVYDKGSRQLTAETATPEPGGGSFYLINRLQTFGYNNDNQLTSALTQRRSSEPGETSLVQESNVSYGVDAAGVMRNYTVSAYNAEGTQVQYALSYSQQYLLGESYMPTVLTMTRTSGTTGPQNNTTTRRYAQDGSLYSFSDQLQSRNNRHYVTNGDGQIIASRQDVGELRDESRNFFVNGQNVGSLTLKRAPQPWDAEFIAGFAFNVDDGVVTGASSQLPPTITAQAGETLRMVAQRLWGDASLWYLLAQENGLSDPDAVLVEGTPLRVPNEVVSVGNSASIFRPYDVNAAIGNTSPEQIVPYVPPPQGKKGCGVVGMILLVVVAVVATVFTAGAAAAAMGAAVTTATGTAAASTVGLWAAGTAALTGGMAAGSVGLGMAAAAIGGAVGSAASQGVGIATGMQDGFDWKGVAMGAIGAGVTAGLGAAGTAALVPNATGRLAAVGRFVNSAGTAGRAAMSSVLTQGISVATGLQSSFSWSEVAISALAAPVAQQASHYGGVVASNLGGAGVASFASQFAGGVAGSVVRGALRGKIDMRSIATDAFGNALGTSITNAFMPAPSSTSQSGGQQAHQTSQSAVSAEAEIEAEVTSVLNGDVSHLVKNAPIQERLPGQTLSQDEQRTQTEDSMREVYVQGEKWNTRKERIYQNLKAGIFFGIGGMKDDDAAIRKAEYIYHTNINAGADHSRDIAFLVDGFTPYGHVKNGVAGLWNVGVKAASGVASLPAIGHASTSDIVDFQERFQEKFQWHPDSPAYNAIGSSMHSGLQSVQAWSEEHIGVGPTIALSATGEFIADAAVITGTGGIVKRVAPEAANTPLWRPSGDSISSPARVAASHSSVSPSLDAAAASAQFQVSIRTGA